MHNKWLGQDLKFKKSHSKLYIVVVLGNWIQDFYTLGKFSIIELYPQPTKLLNTDPEMGIHIEKKNIFMLL